MYSIEELKALIEIVDNSTVGELLIENEAFTIRIRTKDFSKSTTQLVTTSSVASPAPASQIVANEETTHKPTVIKEEAVTAPTSTNAIHEVKSPMIGTFYRSSSPDTPPFVKVGDKVKKGDVLGIIEAMKLFNEIHADADGTIVKVLADNATPVEYDHVLFWME